MRMGPQNRSETPINPPEGAERQARATPNPDNPDRWVGRRCLGRIGHMVMLTPAEVIERYGSQTDDTKGKPE